MKNLCVVITARPSYSRIRSSLEYLQKKDNINLQIILAASALSSKYGNIEKILLDDGFEITEKVYNLVDGEDISTAVKTTGLGMVELSNVFSNIHPDMVLTIADRFETIATAISAAYMNIPLIHIQGGEVTGNIDEKVRHSISKLADIHIVSTLKAKERLIKMGEREDRIYVTGCPSIDIAKNVKDRFDAEKYTPHLVKYDSGVGSLYDGDGKYIVVMLHPVTTEISSAKSQTRAVLDAVRNIDCQVYWFWPNVDAGSDAVSNTIRSYREKGKTNNIYFVKNLPPEDFLELLCGSLCIVGNSSVGIRECSYLGVPAVNIGLRQIGRERGRNVIDVPEYDTNEIARAIEEAKVQPHLSDELYGDGNAGERIANVIASLGDIAINKMLTY